MITVSRITIITHPGPSESKVADDHPVSPGAKAVSPPCTPSSGSPGDFNSLEREMSEQIDADMSIFNLVTAVRDLQKIVAEYPHLLAGEYGDIALASRQLSRIVSKIEQTQKEAAE